MISRFRRACAAAAFSVCMAGPAFAGQAYYEVQGAIANAQTAPLAISDADFEKIGMTEITTTVFALGDQPHKVKGVLMRDLVKYVGGQGTVVKFTALDGYALDIPMSDFQDYDAVVATEIDGKPLSVRDKGPAWLIYPASEHPELKDTVYESRMVWQIKTIEID